MRGMAKFGIGIVSLFLHNHIQAADVATTFTDQQRVSFIKKTIPSNAGEVVMFGEDKLICGAGISNFQDVLDAEKKLAKADPKSLKSIVPTPKKKYGWALIKTAPVGDCAMSEPPAAGCNKAALGQIIDNCGVVYKCARIDGRKRGIGGYSSNAILADSPQAEAALDARLQQEEEAAIKAGGQK